MYLYAYHTYDYKCKLYIPTNYIYFYSLFVCTSPCKTHHPGPLFARCDQNLRRNAESLWIFNPFIGNLTHTERAEHRDCGKHTALIARNLGIGAPVTSHQTWFQRCSPCFIKNRLFFFLRFVLLFRAGLIALMLVLYARLYFHIFLVLSSMMGDVSREGGHVYQSTQAWN